MATLKVKVKSTGQLGTMDSSEFDPNVFDIVQEPSQTTSPSVSQQGLADKTGNFLINLLKSAAQPFVNTAQRVGGAGVELGRSAGISQAEELRKQAGQAAKAGNNALAQKLLDQAIEIGTGASKTNPILDTEEKINKAKDPMQIAKDSAGMLAYAVPMGGKGAQLFKQGATSGALTGFGQSGNSLESVVGNTVLGGVSGGVGAVALSKLLGFGKGAQKTGSEIRQGVINPQVRPSPFMAEEEAAITKTLTDLGVKGSGKEMKQQLPQVFKTLTSQIDDVLSRSSKTVDTADLATQINGALDNNVNVDLTDPVFAKVRDKYIQQILKGTDKGDNVLNVGAKDLFKAKQNLGNQLSRAFDKVDKGTPLTAAEEVGLTIWESMDNLITSLEPGVKQLTKTQSYLYKAAPGIAKSSQASINVLGNRIPAGGLQSLQDATGRTVASTGGALDKVLGLVPPQVGAKIGAIGGASAIAGEGAGSQTNDQMPIEEIMGSIPSVEEYESMVNDTEKTTNDITPEILQVARLTLSDKEYNKLKDIYDLQTGEGGSAEARKQKKAQEVTERILTQLEDLYFKNSLYGGESGISARLGGGAKQLSAILGYNSPLKVYEGIRQSSRPTLARAAGDVGNLSAPEQEAAVAAIPTSGSTLDEAVMGFAEARKKFGLPARKLR